MTDWQVLIVCIGFMYAGIGTGIWITIGNSFSPVEGFIHILFWPVKLWNFHDEVVRGDYED